MVVLGRSRTSVILVPIERREGTLASLSHPMNGMKKKKKKKEIGLRIYKVLSSLKKKKASGVHTPQGTNKALYHLNTCYGTYFPKRKKKYVVTFPSR